MGVYVCRYIFVVTINAENYGTLVLYNLLCHCNAHVFSLRLASVR